MSNKSGLGNILLIYQKKLMTAMILAVVFIINGNLSITYAGSEKLGVEHDRTQQEVESIVRNNSISFENEKVQVGVPLKITGAPQGSIYYWTFTKADGKSNTYTTTLDTYTPVDADMETLITVTVEGMEEAIATIYYSSLPIVYINNTEGYYGVGDEYAGAYLYMQGKEEFGTEEEFFNGDIEIRLRGNSTRWRDKKPFNIKLGKKTDLLGMGKNKHWALLANDIDHTLMRNKLLYDFSGAIGMDTYSKSELVALIFNNEYYGVYQLCELVNVGPNRVDIYDWEEGAETAAEAIVTELVHNGEITEDMAVAAQDKLEDALCEDLSWITSPYSFAYDIDYDGTKEIYKIVDYIEIPEATGGVLLEMDFYAFDGHNASTMITAYSQPIYFKTPEYAKTNTSLFEYMQKYIQTFEYALHSTDFIYHENKSKYRALNQTGGHKELGYLTNNFTANEYDGKHYSELFDFDSLVEYFMVCELSMNWDSMKNSVFMYKDIDGLFYMGPAWDYDWSLGNINMYNINTWYPTSWHTTEEDFTIEQYYQKVQWNRSLIRDPYFLVRVYEKYQEIRRTIIEEMIKSRGTIDAYAEELKAAAAANDARWSYTYPQYQSVGFDESLANMKEFLQTRMHWMDEQFSSLDTFITSLGSYTTSSELTVTEVDVDSNQNYAIITAQVMNSDITSIAFQVNGTHRYVSDVVDYKAICKVPFSNLEKDKQKKNVIHIMAMNSKDEYIIDTMEKGNYYNAKSNYHVFMIDRNVDGNTEVKDESNNSDINDKNSGVDEETTDIDGNATEDIDKSNEVGSIEMNNNVELQDDISMKGKKKVIRNVFIIIMIVSAGVIMQGIGIVIVFKHRKNINNRINNDGKRINNDDNRMDSDDNRLNNVDNTMNNDNDGMNNVDNTMNNDNDGMNNDKDPEKKD